MKYKLVPLEPTEDMILAMDCQWATKAVWIAGVAAAPTTIKELCAPDKDDSIYRDGNELLYKYNSWFSKLISLPEGSDSAQEAAWETQAARIELQRFLLANAEYLLNPEILLYDKLPGPSAEDIFDAGFNVSGEGWNAEYPDDVTSHKGYIQARTTILEELLK